MTSTLLSPPKPQVSDLCITLLKDFPGESLPICPNVMNVIVLKTHSAIHDVCFLLTRFLAIKVTQGSPGFLSSAGRPTGVSIRNPQMNAASECLHSRWRPPPPPPPTPHPHLAQALMTGSFRTECLSRDKWPQTTTYAANRLQETMHGTIKENPVLRKERNCNQVLRPGWAGLWRGGGGSGATIANLSLDRAGQGSGCHQLTVATWVEDRNPSSKQHSFLQGGHLHRRQ